MIAADLMEELQSVIREGRAGVGEITNPLLGNNGKITVYPKTEQEISRLLKFANERSLNVIIAGAGTKKGFGGLEETADILLSLEEYSGIIEHSVGDMILTVKAGTNFKELQDVLAKHNQKIPLDPGWPSNATIGGIIAANDCGPKRLGYGSARDLVIGLRIVYPDGTVIRTGGKTVKNVAGYDMNKLFVGSMGTLGVISEITIKLRPMPKYESLVLLSFPEDKLEEIRKFTAELLDSSMEPQTLELMGPSLSMRLTGEASYMAAIGFEDVEASVRYEAEYVKEKQPMQTRISVLEQNDATAFWDTFYNISPNGCEPSVENETKVTLKIGVKSMDILQVIKKSNLLQDTYNLVIEASGGLGHGLCQINLSGAYTDIVNAVGEFREFAENLGGYAVLKHAPLKIRQQIEVWGNKPPYFFLLEGIKAKIDPNRILNHKRFVGGI